LAHVRARATAAFDQAALDQKLGRLADGGTTDAVRARQFRLGRQTLADGEFATFDPLTQQGCELVVQGQGRGGVEHD
jgi:hypothetical protein